MDIRRGALVLRHVPLQRAFPGGRGCLAVRAHAQQMGANLRSSPARAGIARGSARSEALAVTLPETRFVPTHRLFFDHDLPWPSTYTRPTHSADRARLRGVKRARRSQVRQRFTRGVEGSCRVRRARDARRGLRGQRVDQTTTSSRPVSWPRGASPAPRIARAGLPRPEGLTGAGAVRHHLSQRRIRACARASIDRQRMLTRPPATFTAWWDEILPARADAKA